ncbi:MAG: ABC transporter ATP-binding protein, partial [Actinomycetes bacterium]
MSLEVAGARKEFRRRRSEAVVALGGVDLCVDVGELVALVGPSGSGKTTLLRAVAGLEPLDAGTVTVAGRDVTADPAGERDVALVFQDLALFPHLSVADNVGFGALARGGARDVVRDGVARSAATLGIDHLLDRRPGELSGGERQRVALARALLREPSLFLLDEPLSSLDAELRVRMREEVRDLQRRTGVGMLHVTHDQTEAMAIADRIVVLRAGRVEQAGPPAELWARPDNVFVAGFLGGV